MRCQFKMRCYKTSNVSGDVYLDLVGANVGRVGDLAMGDLNVAFSFEIGNISQRRLSLAFDEPPPCISPCSLINGSESTQISRWTSELSSASFSADRSSSTISYSFKSNSPSSSRLTGPAELPVGATIDMAELRNWAALSRTEGGFFFGTLDTRYCRSRHAIEGDGDGGG